MIKNLKILANLKFAILLLLIIAVIATFGSIVEQEQTLSFYKENYPLKNSTLGIFNWKLIIFLQLNNIYHSFWFLSLLVLFGGSLISCTLLKQLPGFLFSRHCHFYKSIQNSDINYCFSYKPTTGITITNIVKQNFFVFQRKKNIYGYKGILGRISPIIVHLSIICILFGSFVTSIIGFTAQEFVPKTEIFHIQNTTFSGWFTTMKPQAIRVNDFWINYYQTGQIKQFYSDISVLDQNANELSRKTVSVNNPHFYKNCFFYQNDWSISGLRIYNIANKKILQLPVLKTNDKKTWLTWIPFNANINLNKKTVGKIIFIKGYRGSFPLYNSNSKFVEEVSIGEKIINTDYIIDDVISATGLQIKSDLGINIIYSGFGFVMVSTFASYISFSEFWGVLNKSKLIFFGKTNRGKIKFSGEFYKIINKILKL
uniref:c-type cytochrome biogenensis protein n=1 Tax=Fibrocapsa japonica TaxID=94617 RepID=UPI0021158AD9|nr:c-type cytochrome biogenensis protein [Fibrocapsa japonica]YP_010444390.1 c-type cytochrome biogenensis protein [Fibrocapsa japonica]UTE95111.1 c-type cytochrome biogenensis protein [Fibrocapsa japonica]UTE95276.1 c-type cytochrome biogenensis protein [Fibrocapsa japonica]